MENPLIIDFPLKLHTFPSENIVAKLTADDDLCDMIALRNLSYTSLKDLLPPSPISGTWKEIQIKDPLVQHAAWAYLQPMPGEARDGDGDGDGDYDSDRWWGCFETSCCTLLSCLNDVVSVLLTSCLGRPAGN